MNKRIFFPKDKGIRARVVRTGGATIGAVAVFLSIAYAAYAFQARGAKIRDLESRNSELSTALEYAGESLETQIGDLDVQNVAIRDELNSALDENKSLKTDFQDFNDRALKYVNLKTKVAGYKGQNIDIGNSEEELNSLFSLLLDENYGEFDSKYSAVDGLLNENKKKRDEEIAKAREEAARAAAAAAAQKPAPSPAPPPAPTTFRTSGRNQYSSYEQKYVATEVGNFWVDIITIDTNNPNLRIITDTADERDNCWETGCAALPLASYVTRNGGFAGIHGSYFCPPDYSACVDKPYSFDLAAYNSRLGKWVNPYLKFNAVLTFSGKSSALYTGREDALLQQISVTAGIANYPALISGGNLAYANLDSKQANVRSYRGGVGVKDNYIYLVIARSATVPHLAYVMKALGVQYALNLDGGGSSALYYDGYKVGPGRLLPNAIVFAE